MYTRVSSNLEGGKIMLGKKQYTLKELRKLSGHSQKQFAEKIGVTERTVWTYENDLESLQKVSYPMLQLMAKVLDVEVDNIFLG